VHSAREHPTSDVIDLLQKRLARIQYLTAAGEIFVAFSS
jgi:hypothetical protein